MITIRITGRMCHTPELKESQQGKLYTRFRVASRGRNESIFLTVCAFGKTAENVCKYLDKGRWIDASGEFEINNWETKEGEKRSEPRLNADRVEFIGDRERAEEQTSKDSPGEGDLPF